jgi:hypothetical protein
MEEFGTETFESRKKLRHGCKRKFKSTPYKITYLVRLFSKCMVAGYEHVNRISQEMTSKVKFPYIKRCKEIC